MPTAHFCSYCHQVAIGHDLDGEAGSGSDSWIFRWAYVIEAAEAGCPFFQYRLRQFWAADHQQLCFGKGLSLELKFDGPDEDGGDLAAWLECCWACDCGVLTFDEDKDVGQGLRAFGITTNQAHSEARLRRRVGCRPLNLRPASDESLALYGRMLANCRQNHEECRRIYEQKCRTCPSPLRLIEVGAMGSSTVRLASATSLEVAEFAAASYVWGDGVKDYCTTGDNLQQREKDGIQVSTLPRTIRDFIFVSRRLGFAYLWIDALCIAQDDEEEKREQLDLMVRFYLKAEVVLFASMANDSDQGFLLDPRGIEGCYGAIYELPYRRQLSDGFEDGTVLFSEKHLYNENEPIATRMWTLQEERANIRGLHFGSRQVCWICKESQWVDGGRMKPNLNYGFDFNSVQDKSSHILLMEWGDEVAGFSSREFSARSTVSERLSAFSLTVQQHASKCGWPLEQYHIGLWNIDFPWSLLWKRAAPRPCQVLDGPSWSWLSVIGQVEYPFAIQVSWKKLYRSEIQQFPADVTGQAPLILTGRTMTIFHNGRRDVPPYERESDPAGFVWDIELEPQPMWLLEVMVDERKARTRGLILRRGRPHQDSFRRCGYFEVNSAEDFDPGYNPSEWSEVKALSIF